MKALSLQSGAFNALWWRSLGGVAVLLPLWLGRGGRWPKFGVLRLHLARGLPAVVSGFLFFWALERVPMAQSVALTFPIPLIAMFLGVMLLGERLRWAAVLGALIASLGVIVIAGGQARGDAAGALLTGTLALLGAALFYAISLIALRRQAQAAGPVEVALFTGLIFSVVLSLAALVPGVAAAPRLDQLPLILLATGFGTVSSLMFAWAYARAEAGLLSLSEYSAFVWAALLGWLVFGERVSLYTLAGAALIVGGCLAALRHSRQDRA